MENRLIELLKAMNATPEITCPRFNNRDCKGCQFDKGDACDVAGREADYLIKNGVIVPSEDITRQTTNIKKYENEFDEIAKDLFKIDEDYSGGAKVWVRTDVYKKLMRVLALSNHLVKVLKILLTREEALQELEKRKEDK